MELYCVKCKQKTDTDNIEKITTKNNRNAVTGNCKICNTQKYMFIKNSGSSIDIHKLIGKIPRPKSGWTPITYKYLGPYNPLSSQVSFDENTGDIQQIHTQPINKLDEISMNHDICYSINPLNKNDCDRKMVKSIDEMPYKDVNKMAMLTRMIINKKQQLGLGDKKNDTKINDDRKEYTKEMHKCVIHKNQRRMIYSSGIDEIWTADLIILNRQEYVKQNDSYKYILTVMDLFTRYAWVRVTKNKDKQTIADAFEDIIKTSRRPPQRLRTDNGSEFFNNHFKNTLKRLKIIRYTTQSQLKATMIERFNHTLMNKLAVIFTERGNYHYIDDIHNIMDKYNNSYHLSIKMTPIEASKKENEGLVYYNLYGKRRCERYLQNKKAKFKKNDRVRISRLKRHFQKGYVKRWSDEIYLIYKVNSTLLFTYKIKEILENGKYKYIIRNFYENELQKTKF